MFRLWKEHTTSRAKYRRGQYSACSKSSYPTVVYPAGPGCSGINNQNDVLTVYYSVNYNMIDTCKGERNFGVSERFQVAGKIH